MLECNVTLFMGKIATKQDKAQPREKGAFSAMNAYFANIFEILCLFKVLRIDLISFQRKFFLLKLLKDIKKAYQLDC